jgi:hypothetical protein
MTSVGLCSLPSSPYSPVYQPRAAGIMLNGSFLSDVLARIIATVVGGIILTLLASFNDWVKTNSIPLSVGFLGGVVLTAAITFYFFHIHLLLRLSRPFRLPYNLRYLPYLHQNESHNTSPSPRSNFFNGISSFQMKSTDKRWRKKYIMAIMLSGNFSSTTYGLGQQVTLLLLNPSLTKREAFSALLVRRSPSPTDWNTAGKFLLKVFLYVLIRTSSEASYNLMGVRYLSFSEINSLPYFQPLKTTQNLFCLTPEKSIIYLTLISPNRSKKL